MIVEAFEVVELVVDATAVGNDVGNAVVVDGQVVAVVVVVAVM